MKTTTLAACPYCLTVLPVLPFYWDSARVVCHTLIPDPTERDGFRHVGCGKTMQLRRLDHGAYFAPLAAQPSEVERTTARELVAAMCAFPAVASAARTMAALVAALKGRAQ